LLMVDGAHSLRDLTVAVGQPVRGSEGR
jgi:hypothetical protein